VKLLTNPLMLRMALLLFAAGFAFILGTMLVRRMRRSLIAESSVLEERPSQESFPLHTYHAVIQQLKQQKHELMVTQQAERRRAKTSENISAAVLSNLSSGVVFFNPNGLVRQVNAAAKQILGISAPVGMNAGELFGNSEFVTADGSTEPLSEIIAEGLREEALSRRMTVLHITPAGEKRILEMIFSSVFTPGANLLGTACLINDQTELAGIRRENQLRNEVSAEMAMELRNSLATISGYAQQLGSGRDPQLARQLASDIAAEAARLDRTIGGFLASGETAKAAATS
jgi:nitrogen fixation/metabolism regulation signal transduction histidine kinase